MDASAVICRLALVSLAGRDGSSYAPTFLIGILLVFALRPLFFLALYRVWRYLMYLGVSLG